MKKILSIVLLLYSISFVTYVFALDGTMAGISKLYIEYENGESQEIEISPAIDYGYSIDETSNYWQSTGGDLAETLATVTLNQNSNIKRIGIYCTYIGVESNQINGYIGVDFTGEIGDPADAITGYDSVTSWCSGSATMGDTNDFSGIISGVFDFNSELSFTGMQNGIEILVTEGDSFNANDKVVKIRMTALALAFIGGSTQTEDL